MDRVIYIFRLIYSSEYFAHYTSLKLRPVTKYGVYYTIYQATGDIAVKYHKHCNIK